MSREHLCNLLCVSVCLGVVGCEIGPDYKAPKIGLPDINTDSHDNNRKTDELFGATSWWSVFKDQTLHKLEMLALRRNADLKRAAANVEEAMAMAGVTFADLLPSVNASGGGSKTSISQKNAISSYPFRTYNAYNARFQASYELDFWGKYRRANEAALASLLASSAAKDALMLSITAEVAKAYFTIRAIDAKLAIARRTLMSRKESYVVHTSRFKNGYCTELDCLRVEADMRSVQTIVLDLEAASQKAETALSVLIGCDPRTIVVRQTGRGASIERLQIPTNVPGGLPSDLLMRRPDVKLAEELLVAANAQIGVAQAAHLPSISLTGMFGFESNSLTSLCSDKSDAWKFGADITLPIFNGGKIISATDAAIARYKQALADYEKSVQTAFRETLDALVANRQNREVVISRAEQVRALQKSYDIATKQKDAGLIGLIDLLDVERGLLAAEMDLVGALQNQLNAVVDLCKALGGGWKEKQNTD